MTQKTCLDLFSGLGGFSAAFSDSDEWDVVTVDVEERFDPDVCADVMDLRPSDFEREFDVVLAGHPCTYFVNIRRITTGGDSAWVDGEPATDECRDHVAMVYHTVGLVHGLSPEYWFLENPRATLRDILDPPTTSVWYCQYGHDYAKPTDLWGNHPPGFVGQTCHHGNADCHHVKTESYKDHGGGSDNRQGILTENDPAERAKVPYDLSEAIREATDAALAGDVREQVTTDYFLDRKN